MRALSIPFAGTRVSSLSVSEESVVEWKDQSYAVSIVSSCAAAVDQSPNASTMQNVCAIEAQRNFPGKA